MPEQAVEPRASTVVVTSETRSSFMDRKLDIAAPPKAEIAEPAKVEVKAEPVAKAEPEKGEPKVEEQHKEKSHPIKERFSELTQQRDKEREGRIAAEKEAAELRAKLAPPPAPRSDDEPKRDQFASDEEWLKAVIANGVQKELAGRDKSQRETAENARRAQVAAVWNEGVVELKKQEFPDYDAIIAESTAKVHDDVREAIFDSPAGPRILIHIATTKGEAERLAKMTLHKAIKEIGKLEDKYLKPKAAEPKVEVKVEPKKEVEISKAPEPITPLKGASAPVQLPINSKGEWTGTYQEFKAASLAGKIK